jgi:hypothetical protein
MPSAETVRDIQNLLHQKNITIQQEIDIICRMDVSTSDLVRICGLKAVCLDADEGLETVLMLYARYRSSKIDRPSG